MFLSDCSLNPTEHINNLLNQGRYLEARTLTTRQSANSSELRIKQLHALALSKSGTPQAAVEFFEPIYHEHPEDAETAGIMGGIYKELFRQTRQQSFAILSRDAYQNNFTITRNYYTGINAATMSAIAGKFQRGRELAQEVIALLPEQPADFWELVTKAEAVLLNKDPRQAVSLYYQAHQLAGPDWGKLNIVYNQLWMLNHYLLVPAEILKLYSPPTVAVLVGHMIDSPTRAVPRFPASVEGKVQEELNAVIKASNIKIGYTSLACGSDIMFAEAVLASGGEINLYVPFRQTDFIETSVRFAGESWVQRFHQLADHHSVHFLTREGYLGNDELFSFHGRILFGLATLRGKLLHAEPHLVTILSERDRTLKEGGTRDLLKLWPFPKHTHHIDPSKWLPLAPAQKESAPAETVPGGQPNRFVAYMVTLSFSGPIMLEVTHAAGKMQEETLQELIALELEPDRVRAGFTSSHRAIRFAKDLVQLIHQRSKQSGYRIGLHAGPVTIQHVNGKKMMTGDHATLLNKIYDLTIAGSICASETFAASLALDAGTYGFVQTGQVHLGEELGDHNIYSIEWTGSEVSQHVRR
ncbi:MAG TPA: hypothetical protein DDZ56_12035 [Cytophagales bacterium]|mgnify:CR=1 FL=1|nr:hypothetical protein [Cytophagales bacterium]